MRSIRDAAAAGALLLTVLLTVSMGRADALPGAEEIGVLDGWLGSDTHCENLMRPAFVDLGLGRDRTYWTLVFAAPR